MKTAYPPRRLNLRHRCPVCGGYCRSQRHLALHLAQHAERAVRGR